MVSKYKKNVIAYYKDKTKTMVTSINNPFFKLKLDLVLYYCKDNYDIFEAGCGNGDFGLLLAQKVKSYYGVDLTYDMLTYFRERTVQNGMTNIFLVNGDLTSLPIKNDQFDLIFSYSTLYYIKEIKTVMNELYRIF
jgi:ubiquinone/menaquinone biosynthesis C-methylase UbiE